VFGFDLNPDETTLVHIMKSAGYQTGLIGIAHETMHPGNLPFDSMEKGGAASEWESLASSFIESADQPFYLQIGTRDAHRPFGDVEYAEKGIYIPPWLEDAEDARTELAGFQGAINRLDAGVGTILDTLDRNEKGDNTIVMIFSDHGIPFPRAKHSLYEPGCTAAAIVRWPARGWSGGKSVDTLLSGVDVLPTLLEALDLEIPSSVQGRSFLALLENDGDVEREEVFLEQNFNAWTDTSRAIRTKRYKLIANFSPGRGFSDSSQTWRPATTVTFLENGARTYHPPFELFDLEDDPLETKNIAGNPKYHEIEVDLKARLWNWMQRTDDPLMQNPPVPPIYHWARDGLKKAGTQD
jgi:N-sulfoglucosamine sulfohydrolase